MVRIVKVAEGAGFEPAMELPPYTLSRRAPSTTRPPLRAVPSYRRDGWRRLANRLLPCNAGLSAPPGPLLPNGGQQIRQSGLLNCIVRGEATQVILACADPAESLIVQGEQICLAGQ